MFILLQMGCYYLQYVMFGYSETYEEDLQESFLKLEDAQLKI